MASRPAPPTLTPQFCFNTVVLRDFLRTSRAVDDAITQHLNALVTPSRAGFDPASTATRSSPSVSVQPSSYASSSSSSPSDPACRAFRDAVLFPAWQARDDVIQYCEAVVQQSESQTASPAADSDSADDSDPRHTERYDPYIRRRRFAEVEPQMVRLAALMRQEQVVETIVRARSWDVLQGRCGAAVTEAAGGSTGWEAALERWKRR